MRLRARGGVAMRLRARGGEARRLCHCGERENESKGVRNGFESFEIFSIFP